MSDAIPPELFKKVSALKNLSDAIHEIRKQFEQHSELQKDARVLPFPPAPAQQPAKTGVITGTMPLEHLGRKATQTGITTHMIGLKGSAAPHYEVNVDAHKMGKVPHITVSQVGVNGGLISRHPQRFSRIEDAVKSVNTHHKTGVWT